MSLLRKPLIAGMAVFALLACADGDIVNSYFPERTIHEEVVLLENQILADLSASESKVLILDEGRREDYANVWVFSGAGVASYAYTWLDGSWSRKFTGTQSLAGRSPTADLARSFSTSPIAVVSGSIEHYAYHQDGQPTGTYLATLSDAPPTFASAGWFGGTEQRGDTLLGASFKRWSYRRWTTAPTFSWKQTSNPSTSTDSAGHAADEVVLTYSVAYVYIPISVSISGSSSVSVEGDHTWTASTSNGKEPISYSWQTSTDGGSTWAAACGNQATCTLNLQPGDPSFVLAVSVSDGNSAATADQSVTVNIPHVDPLQPYISGPSSVRPSQLCTWFGSATGGVAPYSYTWSGLASGSGSDITFSTEVGGTLYLMVIDADGRTASVSQSVAVSSSAPLCVT